MTVLLVLVGIIVVPAIGGFLSLVLKNWFENLL